MATTGSGNFKIKVLTPSGLLLSEETDSVKLPSSDGEIGILPQHTKYSGVLGTGTLEYTVAGGAANGTVRKLVLDCGLIQFDVDTLTVLADTVQGDIAQANQK